MTFIDLTRGCGSRVGLENNTARLDTSLMSVYIHCVRHAVRTTMGPSLRLQCNHGKEQQLLSLFLEHVVPRA